MPGKDVFDQYLQALRKTSSKDKTEHTDRTALENLLQAIARDVAKDLAVHQETKQQKVGKGSSPAEKRGAPDFKVTKSGISILGYVECKPINWDLNKVLKSDQIAKYKTLSENIVVTDYLKFIWISKYGALKTKRLCEEADLENPKFKPKEENIAAVKELLNAFLSTAPKAIDNSEQLALALATRSRILRDYLGDELVRQEREHKEGRLYGLFQIFRDQVFHELMLKEFADAFAQMLAYGLFLARLNSGSNLVTLDNAQQYVPGSFQLISELVKFLDELEKNEYRDIRWVIEELLSIVNGLAVC